ncbi:alpha/beta-hydrolase domain protein [Senna tora]|uniref:Alpha/beta-hydrolase domain protein n=1 Tax=Senna tora TaxID=362788 RepID=A0A834TCQ2_9FABA|nr:alpha/beta-hydrolase domain protein [Senna tora]
MDILTNLLRLTSFISDQFIQFVEDLVVRDADRWKEDYVFNPGVFSSVHCTKSYTSTSSSRPESGGSIHGICGRGTVDIIEELLVDTGSVILNPIDISVVVPLFFKGLTLPLVGLQYAFSLAICPWKYFLSCIRCAQARVHRITSRVWKTLLGSSGDIGWLQHASGMPPVEDGTARFLELLSHIRNGEHSLPNSFVYLLIPGIAEFTMYHLFTMLFRLEDPLVTGLFSNHGPLYFVATKRFFSKMGLACQIAKVHSEASVEHNAWELKLYIEELYWGSGKPLMLLGHSKGGVDAAAALSMYWSDLKDKVAGLALVQSPYGGTPIASDILREGQIADKETRRILKLLICKGDMRALEDLTYEKRREFITKHKLPLEVPLISFHSEASIAPGVLATMTLIAHVELPWLPLTSFGAVESDLRYGEKSDGLVTCRDAEVPGSVVVRADRKLDHAWMVYSSNKRNPSEPDAYEMCEALLTLLVELSKTKKEMEQVKQ